MFYSPRGWFAEIAPDGTVRLRVIGGPVHQSHAAAELRAELVVDRSEWVEMLAALSGKSQEQVEEFWQAGRR